MTDVDVLVVGGGPAGLAVALAAARAGRSVRLAEAAPTLGGMAASLTVAGQRVDLGSHRLHPSASPPVRALLDELLGDDLQVRERDGRLRLRDRWVRFPFRPPDLVRSLPPSFVAAAARDMVTRPRRRPTDDSYAEVVRVGLGPAALADFHGPMATKLWGVDPGRLSGELAEKRLPVRTTSGLARRIARTSRAGGRVFLFPRLGYGQIVERLADAAADAGADLRVDTPVAGLDLGPHGVTATVGGPTGATLRAGRVLWAAPLAPLAAAVAGTAHDAGPLDTGVAHRGLVLAYLAVPTAPFTRFDAHYVPDPGVAFSRLSEPRNYRDGPDPDDRTVLCAELPSTVGDDVWRLTAPEAGELVLDGMARCGLSPPPVDHVEVVRLPSVYPVLTTADARRRADVLAWADALPGVTVLGRQGRVVADNLHHVLDMALAAVECLDADGRWDHAAWERARARFADFVVED